MLLTIIIPMYNVSQYLEKCVGNINIKNIEYEILMINDGSPDNSLDIANKLALKNERIKVLSQENKGLGGARNLGIKNAKGKYLLFLDADDILIKQDYSFLKDEYFDIMEFSAKNISAKGIVISEFNANQNNLILNGIEYWENNKSMFSACNKIYNKEFLLKNNLFFKEKIFLEDFEFNTRTFFKSKCIKSSSEIIQHFVQVNNSITRNTDKQKKQKMLKDMVSIAIEIREFKLANSTTGIENRFFNQRLTWLSVDIVYHSIKNKLGLKFLLENIKMMKIKNCFMLNEKLPHENKNRFRKFLKIIPLIS